MTSDNELDGATSSENAGYGTGATDTYETPVNEPLVGAYTPPPLLDGGTIAVIAHAVAKAMEPTNAALRDVAQKVAAVHNSLAQIGAGVKIQPPAERMSSTPEDQTYGHITWSGQTRADPRTVTPDAEIGQLGQTNP
jgi:hypothetical protein